jgi:ribosomal-protein-alanine N-acetyltransferase
VIQLRPFEKADLAEAFRLDQICFPPSIAYTKAELRCFVSSPTAYALIVTIDVAPDKRRSGIATMLMDAAEAHYHTLGCATITLEVAVDNAGAQAFYSKRGFLTIGVKRGYYNGVLDAFTMSKVLEDRG